MTVAALPSWINYNENGVTTAFAVPFRFRAGTLLVRRSSPGAAIATLTAGVDYSVTGGSTDAGGTVTIAVPVSGTILLISRRTPRAQAMIYTTGDRFPAKSHEEALDTLTLALQEADDATAALSDRAVRAPIGEAGFELPVVGSAERTGKVRFLGTTALGALALIDATGLKGDPGGNVLSIGTLAQAAALSIPAGAGLVQVSGGAAEGDAIAGLRLVSDPAVDAASVAANPLTQFRDASGRGFRAVRTDKLRNNVTNAVLLISGDSKAAGAAATGGYAHHSAPGGVTVKSNAWAAQLAIREGRVPRNISVGGRTSIGQPPWTMAETIAPGTDVVLATGANDARQYTTEGQYQVVRESKRAEIVYCAAQNSFIRGNQMTTAGAWSDTTTPLLGGGLWLFGKSTQAVGATIEATVYGSAVAVLVNVIDPVLFPAAVAYVVEEYIGSSWVAMGDPQYPLNATSTFVDDTGHAVAARCLFFGGLPDQAHRVRVRSAAVQVPYALEVGGIAGIGASAALGRTQVRVANTTRMTTAGYAGNGGSDATVARINQIFAEEVALLASYGLPVALADVCSALAPNGTNISGDGLHESDAGHAICANVIEEAGGGFVTAADRGKRSAFKRMADGSVLAPGTIQLLKDLGVRISRDGTYRLYHTDATTGTITSGLGLISASVLEMFSGTGAHGFQSRGRSGNYVEWNSDGDINHTGNHLIDGVRVLTNRQAAIASPAGGATIDTEGRAATAAILTTLRAHGLIAP